MFSKFQIEYEGVWFHLAYLAAIFVICLIVILGSAIGLYRQNYWNAHPCENLRRSIGNQHGYSTPDFKYGDVMCPGFTIK